MTDDQIYDMTLAQSYKDLQASPAWKDLQAKIHQKVEHSEVMAVAVTADAPFRTRDALMREWQIRRKCEMEMLSVFTNADKVLKAIQEEQSNERDAERDRSSRAGW